MFSLYAEQMKNNLEQMKGDILGNIREQLDTLITEMLGRNFCKQLLGYKQPRTNPRCNKGVLISSSLSVLILFQRFRNLFLSLNKWLRLACLTDS